MIDPFTLGTPFFIGYGAVCLIAWRLLAGYYAYSSPHSNRHVDHQTGRSSDHPKGGQPDWAWGFWAGLGTVAFWPLVITGLCVAATLHNWPKGLTTPTERQGMEKEAERQRTERYKNLVTTNDKTTHKELDTGVMTDDDYVDYHGKGVSNPGWD